MATNHLPWHVNPCLASEYDRLLQTVPNSVGEIPENNHMTMLGCESLELTKSKKMSLDRISNRPRCKRYSKAEWAGVRQIFIHLYIDQEMTLQETISKLSEEHDFHANETMFKKRIRAWGIVKNVKAAKKDEAISKMLGCPLTAYTSVQVSPNKLIRHAKSRCKNGALNRECLDWVEKQSKHLAQTQARFTASNMRPNTSVRPQEKFTLIQRLMPSLALPDSFANMDLFLRTVKDFAVTRDTVILQTQKNLAERIVATLYGGIQYWNGRAFRSSRRALLEAAGIILEDLQRGNTSAIDILYYADPVRWGSNGQAVFHEFAEYMVKTTSQVLGQNHPYALLMRELRATKSTEERVAMWDCILDHCQGPDQDIHEWWHTESCRWLYCRQIGMPSRATRYCKQAAATMRKFSKLDITMEVAVLLQLGANHIETGDFESAKAAYDGVIRLASVDLKNRWYMKSSALYHLAVMHERCGEVDRAVSCLEKDIETMLAFDKVDAPRTIDVFQRLLRLCERNELQHEVDLLQKRYTELHKCLQNITEKLWNAELGNEVVDEDTQNYVLDHRNRLNDGKRPTILGPTQHIMNLNLNGCQQLSPICGINFNKFRYMAKTNTSSLV